MESSVGATAVASVHIPTLTHAPVISREVIFANITIHIRVPKTAEWGSYPYDGGEIDFLQFHHNLRGGRVNFFLHDTDEAVLGKIITARATIMKKRLEDGREYFYVDLFPLHEGDPVMYRLVVIDDAPGDTERMFVFPTPKPLSGFIVVTEAGAKVASAKATPPTPTTSTKPALRFSGDTQLTRLLDDGWRIVAEDEHKFSLVKAGKGGSEKHMIHYRPKPGKKSGKKN